MNVRLSPKLAVVTAAFVTAGALAYACTSAGTRGTSAATGDAATRVYVPPGTHDEFYAFVSGGFSGQLMVYGIPSGRLLKVSGVFSQNPETGYGYNEESKPLLQTTHGFIPWDDLHHLQVSQTNGVPDGRWVFVHAVNTPRLGRVDLTTFETTEVLEIPNSAGGHAAPFITPDTRYAVSATRFSVPVPNADVPISSYAENFRGTLTFVRADQPGQMEIAFQLLVPGYNYDLGHAGKGPSDGWFFFTTYNAERAFSKLEQTASQADKDYIAAVNYRTAEQCVAQGKAQTVPAEYFHNTVDHGSHVARSERKSGVRMLAPRDCPGALYLLPTPKSPHGVDVDPTGEYVVAGGKLATVIPVHSFSKMIKAIEAREFEGEQDGIPVLKYTATLAGEVQKPGLGPLHTEFDGKGNAYTSMFISSEVVKWKLGTWEVLDRIPVYYSVGHIMIPGGDSREPWGKYLVAYNKITKDRYLPVGPELPQSAQLIDITGDKMKLLLDFPSLGEPHYAQAVPADLIKEKSVKFYRLTENTHPHATKSEAASGIRREGKTVHVDMIAIRSHFAPDNIEGVQVGDTVLFHVTNIEQDWDVVHGFAIKAAENAEIIISPGATRTLRWVPKKPGVYPFFCTDFCSALHQEMSGYARVSPAGSNVPLVASISGRAASQSTRAREVVPGQSAQPTRR